MRYEKFYIQKMPTTTAGGQSVEYDLKETVSAFRWWCMSLPFAAGGEVKKLPTNEWPGDDGVEEYCPSDGLPLSSYDIELQFGFRWRGSNGPYGINNRMGEAQAALDTFREYLTGRDGTGVWLMFYSEWNGIGRQKVRLVSISNEPEYIKTQQGEVLVCKVKLKVTDPRTRVFPDWVHNKLSAESRAPIQVAGESENGSEIEQQ